MLIFNNIYNSFLVFINSHQRSPLKINNVNEKPVDNNNAQHSQADVPCRSCTDFRTFSRMRRQEFSQSQVHSLSSQSKDNNDETKILEHQRDDCPLDKDELGRSTWKLLHTIAATYSDEPSHEDQSNMEQFIRLIPKVYPCEVCANDFSEILTYHPPNISSQKSFAKWMCEVHNMVNRKLEKPLFDCSKVNERWRDGWADGHCE
ncbi:FAD-linked sulfhydryl oxidase ALR-like [Metopolophium dirhodum]|uniref:FAD-linked sulfhydryl oxidase ALR-like n=1 Tax=Metopolophium dirhodum TaxID=44670 RepID=UPI00298F71C0|nr:FAD-linked sulfhydryl oxidase ALR-like [Metopolophium dirhodum]